MSPADVARWMTHIRSGRGYITPEDWSVTLRLLRTAPIAIVNRGIFTPSMVEDVLAQGGFRLVFVDHIQRMRLAKSESRNQELEQCAAELKGLAMQYKASVFALCQLNRLAENIEHPTIAHLRDSGGLEQEADTVFGLSHVGDRLRADPMKATLRCATLKSRHGPEQLEQIAWFHKATKRFEWLPQGPDWRQVQ
jgi:replicative DNA helicase